jgi:hypothetical protein
LFKINKENIRRKQNEQKIAIPLILELLLISIVLENKKD